MAGFLDGEGTFSIKGYKDEYNGTAIRRFGLYINVCNTHPGVLLHLKKTFGFGHFGMIKETKGKGRWKQAYHWVVSCRNAAEVLLAVYPYLIVKKPQAEVMLKFLKTINSKNTKSISEELLAHRVSLKKEINELNRRGVR
jgi:hypothetical protein